MASTQTVRILEPVIVELSVAGFEPCLVEGLDGAGERALGHLFKSAAKISGRRFVDEVLVRCVNPSRPLPAYASLLEIERARLRRGLVRACGLEPEWRSLYGSHLTPDERVQALLVWRRQQRVSVLDYLRERRQELAARAERGGDPDYLSASETPLAEVEAVARRAHASITAVAGTARAATELFAHVDAPRRFAEQMTALHSQLSAFGALGAGVGTGAGVSFRADVVQKRLLGYGATPHVASLIGRPMTALTLASSTTAAIERELRPLRLHPGLAAATKDLRLAGSVLGASGQVGMSPALRSALRMSETVGVRDALMQPGLLAMSEHLRRVIQASEGLTSSPAYRALAVTSPGSALSSLALSTSALEGIVSGPWARWREEMAALNAIAAAWEKRALWVLLGKLDLEHVAALHALSPAAVEPVILAAIETVICSTSFTQALRGSIKKAPLLTPRQREVLDDALERTSEGRYVRATANLYIGLEGAFWEAAYAQRVVTPERRRLDNPNRKVGFESMVKLFDLEPELQTLLVRELYGAVGNPFRHGADTTFEEDRRQVLLGVLALCGWLEAFADQPALLVLAQSVGKALPGVIADTLRVQ